MPNPKRRHSQQRTATRRAHDALKASGLSECPELPRAQAAAPRLPANAGNTRAVKSSKSPQE